MKALEKERNRRYETSSALADDVKRFLDNQPVEASPPSTLYYASRFVRRNRSAVATVVSVFLTLVAATVVTTRQWLRSEQLAKENQIKSIELASQVEELRTTSAALQVSAYRQSTLIASQALSQSNLPRAYEQLGSHIPGDDQAKDLRELEWYALASLCEANRADWIIGKGSWCLSKDRSTLAKSSDGVILRTDVSSRQQTKTAANAELAESASLVAIANDGNRAVIRVPGGLRIEELTTKKCVLVTGEDSHRGAVMSPDGKLGANLTEDQTVQVWETNSGKTKWSISAFKKPANQGLQFIEFTEDSRRLITVFKRAEEGVIVWDVASGVQRDIRTGRAFLPVDAAMIDGDRLIVGGEGGLKIVDISGEEKVVVDDDSGEPIWLPSKKAVTCLALSPDRQFMAVATTKHEAQIWDLRSMEKT